MKYQLIVQLPEILLNFDELIDVEDTLIEALSDTEDLDGHDFGEGEINFFILTNNPTKTFNTIKGLIESKLTKDQYCVAYREVGNENYVVLWPTGLTSFIVK